MYSPASQMTQQNSLDEQTRQTSGSVCTPLHGRFSNNAKGSDGEQKICVQGYRFTLYRSFITSTHKCRKCGLIIIEE